MKKVVIFFIASFLGSLAGTIIRVETAIYTQQIKESFLLLAFFTIAFMLGRGLASILSGRIFDISSDKARKLTIISFISLSLTSLLYMIPDVNLYIFLRLLMGFFSGLSWPIVQSMLLSISEENVKSRNMNIYFISGSIGMTLAYVTIGFVSGWVNILIGSFFFALTALIISTMRAEIHVPRTSGKPTHEFIIFAVSLGFMQVILSSDILVGIIFLKGFNRTILVIILSVFSIASIALSPIISIIIAYISDIRKIEIGIVVSVIAYITALITLLLTINVVLIILSLIVIRACIMAYRSVITASAKSRGIGLKIGIINSVSNISVAVSSAILGVMLGASIILPLAIISSIIIVPAIISLRELSRKLEFS